MRAKFFYIPAILFLCLAAAAQDKPEQAAQKSAESWLTLVDSGNYGQSWDQAAQLFRTAVTRDEWSGKIRAVRDPLGKVTSRKLKSATYTKTLPGAPDGEYVVLQSLSASVGSTRRPFAAGRCGGRACAEIRRARFRRLPVRPRSDCHSSA